MNILNFEKYLMLVVSFMLLFGCGRLNHEPSVHVGPDRKRDLKIEYESLNCEKLEVKNGGAVLVRTIASEKQAESLLKLKDELARDVKSYIFTRHDIVDILGEPTGRSKEMNFIQYTFVNDEITILSLLFECRSEDTNIVNSVNVMLPM